MTYNKNEQKGFSLVEIIVALAILSISTSVSIPIITRNRWQMDVDRYATQLESGVYGLRARLGSRKTSCSIIFPAKFSFLEPQVITEFSQGLNISSFNCCDSEISSLVNDQDCEFGHPGHQLSEITGRPLDNLRLVQTESTPESQNVRVAVSTTNFGFTPPGTTAEAETLTFLICHQRSTSKANPTSCIAGQNRLSIRCVQIDGTGSVERGRWVNQAGNSLVNNGHCQAT
jgi:prepilin-type N-terminal cleavage/methylation domain-containing protein